MIQSLLNLEQASFLMDCMQRCQTGRSGIIALLPAHTKVAHKTGTFSRATNDGGLIELPSQSGYLSVSILIKDSNTSLPEKERLVAETALLLFNNDI